MRAGNEFGRELRWMAAARARSEAAPPPAVLPPPRESPDEGLLAAMRDDLEQEMLTELDAAIAESERVLRGMERREEREEQQLEQRREAAQLAELVAARVVEELQPWA